MVSKKHILIFVHLIILSIFLMLIYMTSFNSYGLSGKYSKLQIYFDGYYIRGNRTNELSLNFYYTGVYDLKVKDLSISVLYDENGTNKLIVKKGCSSGDFVRLSDSLLKTYNINTIESNSLFTNIKNEKYINNNMKIKIEYLNEDNVKIVDYFDLHFRNI